MSISSVEIKMEYPPNNIFHPGDTVTGTITFRVRKEIHVMNIIVSLKGFGRLCLKNVKNRRRQHNHYNNVNYVDLDEIILEREKYMPLGPNTYSRQIEFQLPNNIPPTLDFIKTTKKYSVRCKTVYYIRIRFDCPNFIFNKHYKIDIHVGSGLLIPKQSMKETEYVKTSYLQISSSPPVVSVIITVRVHSPVVAPDSKVFFVILIENFSASPVAITSVTLVEIYAFVTRFNMKVRTHETISSATISKAPVLRNGKEAFQSEVFVPSDLFTFDDEKMISKTYVLRVVVKSIDSKQIIGFNVPIEIGETIHKERLDLGIKRINKLETIFPWEKMLEYNKAELEKENIPLNTPVPESEFEYIV